MDTSKPDAYRMGPESFVYGFFSACFVALGVVALLESTAEDLTPIGLLRVGGAWSIAAFLGLRMARLGVFIEHDGVRVRNPLKTRRIPWSDIRGFLLRPSFLGEFGIVELHQGRTIKLWGIQPRRRLTARDRWAELAIGRLNQELQEARRSGWSRSEGDRRAPGRPRTA